METWLVGGGAVIGREQEAREEEDLAGIEST
jgi:hypothetical protein